jgi:hypothetical protein
VSGRAGGWVGGMTERTGGCGGPGWASGGGGIMWYHHEPGGWVGRVTVRTGGCGDLGWASGGGHVNVLTQQVQPGDAKRSAASSGSCVRWQGVGGGRGQWAVGAWGGLAGVQ